MKAADLLARALQAEPDSAERILYAVAAFNTLTRGRLVLVGGGAQITHTGVGRLTDIDLVGHLTDADLTAIADAGFERIGRHWVYEDSGDMIAIEIPDTTLIGEHPPELVEVDGVVVGIISLDDLMMDRLVQATDATPVTWDEARLLAGAAGDRINWDAIHTRCHILAGTEPFMRALPDLVTRLRATD